MNLDATSLTDVAYLDDAIDMQQFRGGDPRGVSVP